jgi:hypothetical protein
MARLIEIISTTEGKHHILFGFNADELSSFGIQLWITKFGKRYVDWAQALGMDFITFMGGDLWIHNSNEVPRVNFYGEQKDCIIGIVSNEEPTKVKVFDSIGIDSDGEWIVDEVIISPSLNYPQGMASNIPIEHFKKRNGIWQAHFLRNMQTNQSTSSILDAIQGEELRGEECYLTLKNVNNTTGEQVKLFRVDINCTSSR